MSTQKSIKLSNYVEYPYLIPIIYLDIDIGIDYVDVQSLMIIKPKLNESSKLILQGNKIKLLINHFGVLELSIINFASCFLLKYLR